MEKDSTYSVFVADDDDDDRFLMKIAFDKCCPEAKIEFAVDGLDLLSALEQSPSHACLIILDLNMPRLNGFDSLKILRASKTYQSTPIIVFSTSSSERDIQKAQRMGANEYLVKPIDIISLCNMVNKLKVDWNLVDCQ
ncbi:response regulator [Spirosoma utsteinense]|uniref:CheY-like chemotaxis protein n=1 Tax=Spirosoma utsteinense TaxID=2585773 RepID=A0ABR6WDA4_9BACT|nr:response regulator [Spirosoma utsteinense]MBC3788762.1 CheY-like chemotaxis protein [Spirosoma utsteinense]MBC3794507.1 CheY-like chemotaxis protein [Spirosoma utsteinense]